MLGSMERIGFGYWETGLVSRCDSRSSSTRDMAFWKPRNLASSLEGPTHDTHFRITIPAGYVVDDV